MNNRVLSRWRTVLVSVSLGLLQLQAPLVLAQSAKAESGKSASLAGAMPSGAVGYAEFNALGPLLRRIQSSSYLEMVTASPQFRGLEKLPQYKKGNAVRTIVETQLGMDLWKAFEELLSDRLAIAVYPKDRNPAGNGLALLRGASRKTAAWGPITARRRRSSSPDRPPKGACMESTRVSPNLWRGI